MVVIREVTDLDDNPELRPPLYNAEDYIVGVRKFGRKGAARLYIDGGGPAVPSEKETKKEKKSRKDSKSDSRIARQEMSMKQFNNISELLKKLRLDLKLSFPSFVREFVSDPYDGVTGLLDVLKMLQLSQTDYAASLNGSLRSKEHHNFFRRALTDEYDCLLCLRHCLRYEDTAAKLVSYAHGLYTVAVCTMSNFSKSRTLALELLTVACETAPRGHQQVLEAASTLRLRFGEPVRFKFLVGMLSSFGAASFQTACLRFLNRLLETSSDRSERVHLQAEIEESGFNVHAIKKFLNPENNEHTAVLEELERWTRGYLDVDQLCNSVQHELELNRRLTAQLSALKDDVKKSENAEQSSRQNELRMRTRVGELERQIDFYKQQLILAQRETRSLRLATVAPRSGDRRYSSLCLPPEDGVGIDEAPSTSRKEAKPEEKEKESGSDEDNDKRPVSVSEREDFENDNFCAEVIEVHNDMITYSPYRDFGTQTLPRSQARPSSEDDSSSADRSGQSKKFNQQTPVLDVAEGRPDAGYDEVDAADIQEAMQQLAAVLQDAESSLSMTSGRSDCSADTVLRGDVSYEHERVSSLEQPQDRNHEANLDRHHRRLLEEYDEQTIIPTRLPHPPTRRRCASPSLADGRKRSGEEDRAGSGMRWKSEEVKPGLWYGPGGFKKQQQMMATRIDDDLQDGEVELPRRHQNAGPLFSGVSRDSTGRQLSAVTSSSAVRRAGSLCGPRPWQSGAPPRGRSANFSCEPRRLGGSSGNFISRGHSNAGRYSHGSDNRNTVTTERARRERGRQVCVRVPSPDYSSLGSDSSTYGCPKSSSVVRLNVTAGGVSTHSHRIMDLPSALY